MTNTTIAQQLQKQARELAKKRENLYRIRAYRTAANIVLSLPREIDAYQESDLATIPGIGQHLALAIANYVRTGVWQTYAELTASDLAV